MVIGLSSTNAIITVVMAAVAVMTMLVVVGGCRTSPPPATISSEPLVVQGDPDRLWQLGQAELKSRGFRLDRVDRRNGVIRTYPATSGQWFEFWRGDVVGARQSAQSNLQTVRRRVRLAMTPLADERCRLECTVVVEQLHAEGSVVSGTVRARDIFDGAAGRIPALTIRNSPGRSVEWGEIATDPALANDILHSIKNALKQGV